MLDRQQLVVISSQAQLAVKLQEAKMYGNEQLKDQPMKSG